MPSPGDNVLTNTQAAVREALQKLGYEEPVYDLLAEPIRVFTVRIPVRMDDGHTEVFTGYRAQHNDAIGPTKGGIRFHPNVSLDEVKALSIWMSLKCGIFNLPYGGAKGGIICDPRSMSMNEQERLARGYVRAVSQIVGPAKDIPAPDVYTNPQIMAWMYDEYSHIREFDSPGFITGKPLVLGGSQGRNQATALGVCIAMREAASRQKKDVRDLRVIVQGFGNVGSNVALILHEMGAKVVGISDAGGGLYDEKGLDVPSLIDQKDSFGMVTPAFQNVISNEDLLTQPCDVLIPAALENQLHEGNAHDIQASIVIEAANGPTTPVADEILHERGVLVVPDVLANAGGVTVSYFEWVQNNQGWYWSEAEVNSRLEHMMIQSVQNILQTAERYDVSPRLAAYMVGIRPFAEAMRWRGWV
ncbi:Glu/Leu/Phe/Val family dehydrogenase [Alicyclobacillus fodiniaquatilis]|uniref:Glutamate dehydrogenase n=1 Tax=Alicyclobacillus fodiniaquatilis TaxID=1661150 RepID=A0ABW4JLG5_9BACL